MPSIELTVSHPAGLHARPASKFVQTANQFNCDIKVSNLTTTSQEVNAKSILSILTLGVNQNHRIRVEAIGEQAEEALAEIRTLIDSNFEEG